MPGRYREQRLENAVIRVSGEPIPDKHLYDCLWEALEAVLAAEKKPGPPPYQRKETVLHENDR